MPKVATATKPRNNTIEENLMTRPFSVLVDGLYCAGEQGSALFLYCTTHNLRLSKEIARLLVSFLLLLADGLGESMGGKRF
jgi:hypothetical protein